MSLWSCEIWALVWSICVWSVEVDVELWACERGVCKKKRLQVIPKITEKKKSPIRIKSRRRI